MKYVLDACVVVAALRKGEPFHREALRRCMPLFAGRDEIVVPALFELEVTAALARRGSAMVSIERVFRRHLASRTVVTIGPRAIAAVRTVIGLTRLRAADALYVWVAAREQVPLVTMDDELLERASLAGVDVSTP